MFLGSQIENKSLLKSISTLFNKGGNVFQLFLRKMNSSSVKDKINIPIEEQKEIKNFIKKNNIKGYVHASYLLNFCKIPVGLLRIQWAYNMLKEDIHTRDSVIDNHIENVIIRHRNDKKDGKIEICLIGGITIIANPYILLGIGVVVIGTIGYNYYKKEIKLN